MANYSFQPQAIERRSRPALKDAGMAVHTTIASEPSSGVPLRQFERPEHLLRGNTRSTLEQARETAVQMIEHARAAAEATAQQIREQAFQQGYNEGLEKADQESRSLIETAEAIAMNVAKERELLIADAEGEIIDLAIAVAGRLVDATIDMEPQRVADVCRGAIRKAFQRERISVLAHPDDVGYLRMIRTNIQEEMGGIEYLEIIEERRVERGSVIVRTPAGEIDATFSSKLGIIQSELRSLVTARRGDRRADPLGDVATGDTRDDLGFAA